WAGSSSYRTYCPRGHNWRWPVYGRGKHPEMGRTVSVAGLYYRRTVRLLYHALNGRNVIPGAGSRFLCRLRAPLYEPVLRLSHRLVILVYVDGGGHLRDHRHWRVCAVLVPGDGAVDPGTYRRRAGRYGEPRGGSSVRRN